MQLKKHRILRKALAAATCSLLGITPGVIMAATDQTQADSAVFYYTEKNRINVTETAAIITVPLNEEETLTISPTLDVITGASPNGATPTNKTQTFGSTVIPAGQLPLTQITDKRYAIDLQWQYPVGRMSRSVIGGDISSEKDYASVGASYSHMWDLDRKLTTLTAGLSGSRDTITPSTGVIYQGLSPLNALSTLSARAVQLHTFTRASGGSTSTSTSTSAGGSTRITNSSSPQQPTRNKQTVDGLVGVTRVINRRTLMQFNYGLGITTGYLTDPYKIISLVDSVTGETTGYVTEQRPGNRLRQTLFWKTVFHLPRDVVHLSYRHYWDEWQIKSDTFELNYHFKLGSGGYYFEPQLRYYTQSAANFYHYRLVSGATLPQNASADFRLAGMTSFTYGLKFAVPLSNDGELSIHAMVMKQTGDKHPADAIGVERTQNLNPGLDALSLQLNFAFKF